MSKTSTNVISKELVKEGLVETDMLKSRRYCWLSEKGISFANEINCSVE
jgi:predicted transcriptional regulator